MAQVFLSYSRSDSPFADRLIERLWEKGFETWKDEGYLEGGQEWMAEISRAIENAHAFLVILSEDSIASSDVGKELFLAHESEVDIVPIELEAVSIPHEMRYQLAGIQRIDFSYDFEDGMAGLLRTLTGSKIRAGVADIKSDRRLSGGDKSMLAGMMETKGMDAKMLTLMEQIGHSQDVLKALESEREDLFEAGADASEIHDVDVKMARHDKKCKTLKRQLDQFSERRKGKFAETQKSMDEETERMKPIIQEMLRKSGRIK